MTKTNPGRFFEDYTLGEVIAHAVPRTVSGAERALYHALYPARHALHSSDEFAHASGLRASPLDDLAAFHIVFGKSVPDISLNAVANLGYAEARWLQPVWPGDTLSSQSEVIGLKENSSGKTGVVYVRTSGTNQHGETVMTFVRWVMVRKRDQSAPAPAPVVPALAPAVAAGDLVVPEGLDFTRYDFTRAGEPHRWGNYAPGEQIDHVDGVTIEEAEHMLATRLWQNTAKTHFDASLREDGKRLIYGGLANAQMLVAINAGSHANPCFAGDTVRAWSEVIERAETPAPGVGALRLRLVATKGGAPFTLKGEDGKYLPHVLLDLDYWALVPL
jgi:2-methylfumaryl-CoA hydratase